MFVKRTVIGREIQPDDEMEAEKDAVLLQLYRFHYNIFNPKDVPMSLKRVSEAVRSSEKRVKDICEMLVNDKLVQPIRVPHALFYRITPKGVGFVEKYAPKQELMGAAHR